MAGGAAHVVGVARHRHPLRPSLLYSPVRSPSHVSAPALPASHDVTPTSASLRVTDGR